MKLEKQLDNKLKTDRRTKKWFIDVYCGELKYSAVNLQLLGYNNLSQTVKKAIEKYLGE